MKKLILHTPRLIIRNLTPADIDDFLHYRSNPEVTKYQGFDVMNREQAAAFIEEHTNRVFGKAGEWIQYGIESKSTGKIIGDCAIQLHEDIRIASIGVTISLEYQQQGYAREVLTNIVAHLFEKENVHSIEETVDIENAASIRLLESTGFIRTGYNDSEKEYRYTFLKKPVW